ncbi:MAG: hypothetical protein GC161_15545 [Planctomycetaceae bacterium]|nr:hypothetical protein [Planctomycetaceae bacterium]
MKQERPASARLVLLLVLVMALGSILWAWWPFGAGRVGSSQTDPTGVVPSDRASGPLVELQASGSLPKRTSEAAREGAASLPGEELAPPRDFEAIYRDLVALFLAGGPSAAKRADETSRGEIAGALFLELARSDAAVGERTLGKLDAVVPPWQGEAAQVEVGVCRLILDFELQQMTKGGVRTDQRSALVSALLERMPVAKDFADFAAALLRGQSYLGGEHEPTLLQMANMAEGEYQFLAQPVKQLLVTVWKNLGERRGAHLDELLRVFDDPDAGLIGRAAQQQLLLYEEYRDLVVQHVLQSRDPEAVRELAIFAAQSLPVPIAIEVTATLKEGSAEASLGGAYITLVERSQGDLEGSYRDALTAGLQPGHREQAVLAIANYGERDAAAFAREAFERDPEPRVRGVALLALGSSAEPEDFRDCYQRALGEPSFRDPRQLSYLVSALSNHAPRADRAFLDMATAALLARGDLPQHHVAAIEALRQRYLE